MQPSPRVLLAVATAMFAVVALPAAAAARSPFAGSTPPIRALDLPRASSVVTDDGRRRLMTHLGDDDATGYATVDLVTGATSPLPAPPQCDHLQYHASGHGGLGFLCGSLFDRQTLLVHGFGTGAWSTLPVPEEAYGAADDDAFLFQVGRYWLGFRTHGYHYRNNTTYISRSGSGATLPPYGFANGDVVDVDSPTGGSPTSACDRPHPPGPAWDATSQGPYHATVVSVRRCGGGPARTLCRGRCLLRGLHGHLVVWERTPDVNTQWRVYFRNLRTGRTTRIAIPRRNVAVWLVADRIVVEAFDSTYHPTGIGIVRR